MLRALVMELPALLSHFQEAALLSHFQEAASRKEQQLEAERMAEKEAANMKHATSEWPCAEHIFRLKVGGPDCVQRPHELGIGGPGFDSRATSERPVG